MTTKIACSACRTIFEAGATSCPNCGLQLVAQALPVISQKPWWRTFYGVIIIVCALVALLILASEIVK
jgi:hypothetical protein